MYTKNHAPKILIVKPGSARLLSVDALRGLMILFMLLDHVRETFFLHMQVSDPMDVTSTTVGLFCSRTLAHLCAPIFVFLSGVSSNLYAAKYRHIYNISHFLFKRGIFLILLELTLINFAWTFQFPPTVIYLQVIWIFGLSMIALSLLCRLPHWLLFTLGVVIIFGHNLLDPLYFDTGSPMYVVWTILHDRNWIEIGSLLKIRISYPLLPWIGVICLGYVAGDIFHKDVAWQKRRNIFIALGTMTCGIFLILRFVNIYGENPWLRIDNWYLTLMSFFNLTKYPPSLLFLCFTLGIGFFLLVFLEYWQNKPWVRYLTTFGSVPMFFYLSHLYILKFLYLAAQGLWGKNQGEYFGFSSVAEVWLCTIVLALAVYPAMKKFGQFKVTHSHFKWLKYF
ncbi:MAG: DUF1624 domain-containing protein [Spirochaetia bacterium]